MELMVINKIKSLSTIHRSRNVGDRKGIGVVNCVDQAQLLVDQT